MSYRLFFPIALVLAPASPLAAGMFTISVEPPMQTVLIGQNVSILLEGEFPQGVVGWGLDLTRTAPAVVAQNGAPIILPPWVAASSFDGDDLSALASPFPPTNGSISGLAVPLATINFTATSLGTTDLILSITQADLTEGVALDPVGFADVQLVSGQITVIPEPSSAAVFGLIATIAMRRHRKRSLPHH